MKYKLSTDRDKLLLFSGYIAAYEWYCYYYKQLSEQYTTSNSGYHHRQQHRQRQRHNQRPNMPQQWSPPTQQRAGATPHCSLIKCSLL